MCGIAGLVTAKNQEFVDSALRGMGQRLNHRGPDLANSQSWSAQSQKTVGFSHTLLSVMGEVNTSQQPVESENLAMVFNGSIYNYQEIHNQETSAGDTRVLFHAFEKEGLKCLNRLRGMFAISLYDKRNHEVILIRDPVGVKPLYYYYGSEGFYFASEYKAILPYIKDLNIDESALADYLRLRFLPREKTLIREIRKVPPGHLVRYNLNSGELKIEKYFVDVPVPEESLFEVLKVAIQRRAIASKEVAALLSGGIDSALVCNFLSEKVSDLSTYTLQVAGHDESGDAKKIAESLEIANHKIAGQAPQIEDLARLIYHLDDPYGDPIILALDQIFKNIQGRQRIVVTGEGSDELFSGYVHHRAMSLLEKMPTAIRSLGGQALSVMPKSFLTKLLPYSGKMSEQDLQVAINRFESFLNSQTLRSFQSIFFTFSDQDLCLPPTREDSPPTKANLENLRKWDFQNWLPESQCFKMDKISMSYGIEAREPFVDIDLIAKVGSLKVEKNFGWKQDKLLLRNAVRGRTRVPESVINSRKTSFFQPINNRENSEFLDSLISLLNDEKSLLTGIIKLETFEGLNRFEQGQLLTQKRIFVLAALIFWFKEVWSLKGSQLSNSASQHVAQARDLRH